MPSRFALPDEDRPVHEDPRDSDDFDMPEDVQMEDAIDPWDAWDDFWDGVDDQSIPYTDAATIDKGR